MQKIIDFMKAVKVEFGKISWPSLKDTMMISLIVVAVVILSGVMIAITDYLVNILIRLIVKL